MNNCPHCHNTGERVSLTPQGRYTLPCDCETGERRRKERQAFDDEAARNATIDREALNERLKPYRKGKRRHLREPLHDDR